MNLREELLWCLAWIEEMNMGRKAKVTPSVIISAMAQTSGNVQQMAKLLGVRRATVHDAIVRYELRAELESARKSILDEVDALLGVRIADGERAAILFALRMVATAPDYLLYQGVDIREHVARWSAGIVRALRAGTIDEDDVRTFLHGDTASIADGLILTAHLAEGGVVMSSPMSGNVTQATIAEPPKFSRKRKAVKK